MRQPEQYRPFRGIKEANKNDQFPNSLAESNTLYAKYWQQGFFAIVGERHQDSWIVKEELKDDEETLVWNKDGEWLLMFSDVYLNLLVQIPDAKLNIDEQGHLGLADYANPLYWLALPLIIFDFNLLTLAFTPGGNIFWLTRLFAGTVGLLVFPVMLAVALSAVCTSVLWTVLKIVVAAVTVTLSSGIWYGAKLIQLNEQEKEWGDMPMFDEASVPEAGGLEP